MKATVVKIWKTDKRGQREQWSLKLDEPIKYGWRYNSETEEEEAEGQTHYLVASAVYDTFYAFCLLYETYLFPANEAFDIIDWDELYGSQKDTTDILQVLTEAGYDVDLESLEAAPVDVDMQEDEENDEDA